MKKKDMYKYGVSVLAVATAFPLGLPAAITIGVGEVMSHIFIDLIYNKKSIDDKLSKQLTQAFDNAKKNAALQLRDSERATALLWHINKNIFIETVSVPQAIERAIKYLSEHPSIEDIKSVAEIFEKCLDKEVLKHDELSKFINKEILSSVLKTIDIFDSRFNYILARQDDLSIRQR